MTPEEITTANDCALRYVGKPWAALSPSEIEQCLELSQLDVEMTSAYVAWLQIQADRYDEIVEAGLAYLEAYANHQLPGETT
ncbi:hypothetical protein [Rhodococcus opacus]|uniref:Uncharacterized protein n=1 Tax=Rhodococcus opacus (strain B4) TaxID=632772 RepID=C1B985_RHOOB|nr:hypothetical protein [Rhodococcus opacus]BAH52238.1 hypothetical protein ROP_39910 [Rhodococcus opacus B4]